MKKYGLIGKTLGHSWSKTWFDQMFAASAITDAEYRLYEMDGLDTLRQWVMQQGINGLNVTLPYKERIIPLLDSLDDEARAIGAVNCVSVEGQRLVGHNTDAPAFRDTLTPRLQPQHTHALVLGTGGASKAVCHALRSLGIEATRVSRQPQLHPHAISYQEAYRMASSCLLVVNTTPVGMYPHTDATPWEDFGCLGWQHLCYDLIYNPKETLFLQRAKERGADTQGGLDMLHRQAALSWAIWSEKL